MGCSVCVDRCPSHAITLVHGLDKPEPLDLDRLMQKG
jgi:ferredoxin